MVDRFARAREHRCGEPAMTFLVAGFTRIAANVPKSHRWATGPKAIWKPFRL
jgi:hypothetical protein